MILKVTLFGDYWDTSRNSCGQSQRSCFFRRKHFERRRAEYLSEKEFLG